MSEKKKKKIRIVLITFIVILAVLAVGVLILLTHTQIIVTEIKYSENYPNIYLDITYPNMDRDASNPTLIYFHGGGFFGGSKSVGDPLAESDATALLDDICAKGPFCESA